MNNNNLFRSIFFIVLFLTHVDCFAQKIENVHPEIAGEKINIYYDLIGIAADQSVIVKVFMSTDGGKTYGESLKSVTGDVGVVVGPGQNRCIKWDVFDEVDELVSLNVKFKVTADLLQTGQSSQTLERIFKLNLNTNLGSKRYLKSKSYGFNLKGAIYLKQLGLGVRGDYYKTFREKINYSETIDGVSHMYPDTGYYWGYAGGAIIEYDLLRNTRYSLYPFLYVGSAKIIYKYDPEYSKDKKYEEDKYFEYSIFGSAGLGFDINIVKFLYLGVELEYYLSPWLDIITLKKQDEGLDGLSIGFVVKFVINPG
jgi:hypothetical protein